MIIKPGSKAASEILISSKGLRENYCVNIIRQTQINRFEIELGDYSELSNQLLDLTIFGMQNTDWNQVMTLLCAQFDAHFGVLIIFDTQSARQILMEFVGDYEKIDFPTNLDFNKAQVAKNWLNCNLNLGNLVGNIVLCRREDVKGFSTGQKHAFAHFCAYIGKVMAE